MSEERERCLNCDKPRATSEDWERIRVAHGCKGDRCGDELCWRSNDDCIGQPVDWRQRALAAERVVEAARRVRDSELLTGRADRGLLAMLHDEIIAYDATKGDR